MAISLYYSNAVEALADDFAARVNAGPDIFAPPLVIVPNPYLKKWLQLRIAEKSGICANIDFQYLEPGLAKIAAMTDPSCSRFSDFISQDDLFIIIVHILLGLDPRKKDTRVLFRYLYKDDASRKADFAKKAWQLSARLARNFFAYGLYRSEMIEAWNQGRLIFNSEMEKAQRYIYTVIFGRGGLASKTGKQGLTLTQHLKKCLESPKASSGSFPEIFFFGKNLLSPFHIKMIYQIGKLCGVSIYQLNPCSEFWEDVTTPAEDRWERIRSIEIIDSLDGEALFENADENTLLKQWGKPGRESVKLLSMLEEAGTKQLNFISQWLESGPGNKKDSILRTLQYLILHRTRHAAEKKAIQDTSLQIIACPDIYREAESVCDSILFNLRNDPALAMTDIAVMVPDMEKYEPVLKSVFSGKSGKISFSLVDSNALRESHSGKAVKSIFDLASGSFSRKEIFGLVMNPCFQEAMGIRREDASAWFELADRLNIFHNNSSGMKYDMFTWDWGLLRLRLGRIMEAQAGRTDEDISLAFKDIIPYQDITLSTAMLSEMSAVIEIVVYQINRIKNSVMSGGEWKRELEELFSKFIAIPEDMREELPVYQAMRESLNRLAMMDNLGGENPPLLPIEMAREYILENLKNMPGSYGNYLVSGINISALVPKRQIPFKIIYILGMNEGTFPGSADSSSVDLRNVKRKIGDISAIDANRYLFLETLISAREKLYISYVAKDLQKDQVLYNNSLLGQLISFIENHILAEKFKIIQVPINGWSARYIDFEKEKIPGTDFLHYSGKGRFFPVHFSLYDRALMYLKILSESGKTHDRDPGLLNQIENMKKNLTPEFTLVRQNEIQERGSDSINLWQLCSFLKNPAESYLRNNLKLFKEDTDEEKEDEPVFSVYPRNREFFTHVMSRYISGGDDFNYLDYFKEYYSNQFLRGSAAGKSFRAIDQENFLYDIAERIEHREHGLSLFKNSRKNRIFYNKVIIGDSYGRSATPGNDADSIVKFPAVSVQVLTEKGERNIEITGSIDSIWKDKSTGDCEVLVILTAWEFSFLQIIYPFLFFMLAKSGFSSELHSLLGAGNFTIHVSHKKRMTSVIYDVPKNVAKTYFEEIVAEFIQDNSFDLLPLEIISKRAVVKKFNEMKNPDAREQGYFRELLIQNINDDAASFFPKYRPDEMTGLLSPGVPEDAYLKIYRRLYLLLNPQSIN